MTDNLDRFAREIIAAALRDDQEALRDNVQSMIVTYRQLQNELEHERADNADAAAYRRVLDVISRAGDVSSARNLALAALRKMRPGTALLAELDAARMVIESLRSRDWETVDRAVSYYTRVTGKP